MAQIVQFPKRREAKESEIDKAIIGLHLFEVAEVRRELVRMQQQIRKLKAQLMLRQVPKDETSSGTADTG